MVERAVEVVVVVSVAVTGGSVEAGKSVDSTTPSPQQAATRTASIKLQTTRLTQSSNPEHQRTHSRHQEDKVTFTPGRT